MLNEEDSERSYARKAISETTGSSELDERELRDHYADSKTEPDNDGKESIITKDTVAHTLDSKKMPEVKWSKENEKIPSEWCDIAKCYKWLHTRAHQKYSNLHAWFTIPAIIFSTISGTASFAQASLPMSFQQYAPMIIGSVNIIIGIFTTIQQYMKISELNESHRVSGIAWDKFARNISIELAKAPEERIMDAGHFLKTYREEFDRLMETSPSIPISITQEFVETYSGKKKMYCWNKLCCKKEKEEEENKLEKETRKKNFKDLKKPDECSTEIVSETGKHDWYNPTRLPVEPVATSIPNELNLVSLESMLSKKINVIHENIKRSEEEHRKALDEKIKIVEEQKQLALKEEARQAKIKEDFRKSTLTLAQKYKAQNKIIEDSIVAFQDNHSRDPLEYELRELINLEGNVDANILNEFCANKYGLA